jgi:hypothetical protein
MGVGEIIENKKTSSHIPNDTFRLYIRITIDDARMYCAECGEFQG